MRTTPGQRRRPHVILAEDDADLREVIAELLRDMGADVESAADGGRFLVSVASQYNEGRTPRQVDLIVTDIAMPVCSGLDILDGIRAARWTTPVIIMTGLQTPTVRARASKLGAKLLIKPLDLDTFRNAVIELLATRPDCVLEALEKA
jgi:DNA-binding response OmpR family regulator